MTDFRFICVRFILFILDLKMLSVTERHTMVQLNHFIESNNLYLKNSRVVILKAYAIEEVTGIRP